MKKGMISGFTVELSLYNRLYNLAATLKRTLVSLLREAVEDIIEKYRKKEDSDN